MRTPGAALPTYDNFRDDPVFKLHEGGKIDIGVTVPVMDRDDLSMAYTPGVARVCTAIAEDKELVYEYTWKSNTVAVVTDGTAVLGLGDIGPEGSLPVMEGKALLFKQFGGVDAVPIALDCTDVNEIVDTVARIAPAFGGVNLEDISAPRCFEIEALLQERLDIPIFHDDQHGTAIVTLAGLIGACRLTGRRLEDLRVVVSGAGAAGVAVTRILLDAGIGEIAVADSRGLINRDRTDLNPVKQALAHDTNTQNRSGTVEEALAGADVFIGLSAGRVSDESVASMADGAFVFAMANPDPEVDPEVAHRNVAVIATGRSDYPNQINNVLAFPGVFKGALAVRAPRITASMKRAAADAIAELIPADELRPGYVIPSVFDPRVAPAVADAVAAAARAEGIARR
ncbi:MAG TPA: NADP-dependent malic enzyme [Mycobacteriales bacterium]|nr:NADP-dependent malic enzyme [Mycobacteriales bacterium]